MILLILLRITLLLLFMCLIRPYNTTLEFSNFGNFYNSLGLLFLALTSRHQSSNPIFGSCQTLLVSEIVVKSVVLILGVYSYKNSNNDAVFANLGPINSVN